MGRERSPYDSRDRERDHKRTRYEDERRSSRRERDERPSRRHDDRRPRSRERPRSRDRDSHRPSSRHASPPKPVPAEPVKPKESAEEEKIRIRQERLAAWKAKKGASASTSAAQSPQPEPSASKAGSFESVPVASPSPSPAPSAPPKKLAYKAGQTLVAKVTTKNLNKKIAASGMDMGDDEEESKTLYKPEEGLAVESGLEPDIPAADHNGMEVDGADNAQEEDDDEDDTDMMDEAELRERQRARLAANEAAAAMDEDTEDTAPSVKPAEPTAAEKAKQKEEEEANALQAAILAQADDDVDPLDAFMADVTQEVAKVNDEDRMRTLNPSLANGTQRKGPALGVLEDEDDMIDDEVPEITEFDNISNAKLTPEAIMALAAKKLKKKEVVAVDHSKINYEPFRKAFYHAPPELAEMTDEQAELLRAELDNIKIRGADCPKPIIKWSHCGLPSSCLDVIKENGYIKPTSIQCQAIPAIMSGRDAIGVAKTGSGKTIAFLLPLFRHVKDQRPLEAHEGPIAMIMTPTRELATQIFKEARPFLKVLGLRAACAYGGSPLKDNIQDLKKGAEVIVCTPGRMIELLTTSSGKVVNLKRITYLVLDEADRMFDLGFEPQVMKIVGQIRPDRQTVLFSATFPRQMEALARKILRNKPLEITVGGRSVVAAEIEQIVEVREEETKFNRLLEILGRTYNDDPEAKTLIFVHRQESADALLRDLFSKNYSCMSLHGGKDQVDRDSTISDFKLGVVPIVIATSVAARGLDVKQLKLVINFDCPNHMEDYVHRAGRTGRAGNKGTCITFITPDQDRYAHDIMKALTASNAKVPAELTKLCEGFVEKVKSGKATAASSGFGGKGLDHLEKDREVKEKTQRVTFGEDEAKTEKKATEDGESITAGASDMDAVKAKAKEMNLPDMDVQIVRGPAPDTSRSYRYMSMANLANLTAAEEAARRAGKGTDGIRKAQDVVARLRAAIDTKKKLGFGPPVLDDGSDHRRRDPDATDYHAIVPINDYPQRARWRVTNKETVQQLIEETGASITNKGVFYDKGKEPAYDEPPKLHLLIESNEEARIAQAINAIKHLLVEAASAALEENSKNPGRYSVL